MPQKTCHYKAEWLGNIIHEIQRSSGAVCDVLKQTINMFINYVKTLIKLLYGQLVLCATNVMYIKVCVLKIFAGRCCGKKASRGVSSTYWTCVGSLLPGCALISSPKCCSYRVSFDICPSITQSVLTSGHVAGWINTSVLCLVKLPLLFLATLTLVSLP